MLCDLSEQALRTMTSRFYDMHVGHKQCYDDLKHPWIGWRMEEHEHEAMMIGLLALFARSWVCVHLHYDPICGI